MKKKSINALICEYVNITHDITYDTIITHESHTNHVILIHVACKRLSKIESERDFSRLKEHEATGNWIILLKLLTYLSYAAGHRCLLIG
jgi:hypothetical protein